MTVMNIKIEKKKPTNSLLNPKNWYIYGIFILATSIISYYSLKWLIVHQVHQVYLINILNFNNFQITRIFFTNLAKNIILRNNSDAFNYWKSPPALITRKYYFFDVQNPDEVQMGIEKPRLVERGPYTYIEKWEKRNIEFLGLEVVRFSPVVTLYFEPNLSNGTENDIITVINVPALVCGFCNSNFLLLYPLTYIFLIIRV